MRGHKTTLGRKLGVIGSTTAMVMSGLLWGSTAVQAAFPGINGKIACASNRTGNSEIFTFNPNGTELEATNLTNNPANDTRPRYSPDGRTIVFESNRDGPTELYLMNADGTNVRRLTFSPATGHGNGAANFSPGGDQIVFQTTRFGQFEIMRIDVDGTNEVRLTTNTVEDSLPAWSPTGDKVAYNSRTVDPAADVHLMEPDGTNSVDITNSPGEDAWAAWSPDASMIAFHSRLEDASGEEIYRIRPDGTGRTRLTFNNVPQGSAAVFDIFPAWSPDGTRIVWNSGRGAANFGEVYQMNAVTGDTDIVRVTNNPAVDQRCDWQPLCTIYGSGDIVGTPGDDIICGSDGPDRISGGAGNDRILGLGGNDQISGGPGSDSLFGGAGNDDLTGGRDIEVTLVGGTGNDRIVADPGELIVRSSGPDQCVVGNVAVACPPPL